MSRVILLCFISLWGFTGSPNGSGNPLPPPPVRLPQDVQYDNYDNLTFPHSDSCRITLSTLSQLRVMVTVDISKWLLMAEESLHSYCLLILREHFTITAASPIVIILSSSLMTDLKGCNTKHKFLVVLLLLLSGNVETNPGPDTPAQCLTPADFKSRSDLEIIHINVRSLLSKLDMIKIWINSTNGDVVLSETWLKKSVHDKDIYINGYNVYRTDHQRKGGEVAIYILSRTLTLN